MTRCAPGAGDRDGDGHDDADSDGVAYAYADAYADADAERGSVDASKGSAWVFLRAGAGRYGGGRLHGWFLAIALAHAGRRVTVITDRPPGFADSLPGGRPGSDPQANPRMWLSPDMAPPSPTEVPPPAWVFVVPGGNADPPLYREALGAAAAARARVALVNFETPDWFNHTAPVPRDPARWDGWRLVARHAHLVLSSAGEGTRWARRFYDDVPSAAVFDHAGPCLNDAALARAEALALPRASPPQLVCISRYRPDDTHKGADQLPGCCVPELAGTHLVLVIGHGGIPADQASALDEATAAAGMTWSKRVAPDEDAKFALLASASAVVVPSWFEGFGYPPVEAICAGVPPVAYDLPVLREVCGAALRTAPLGDAAELGRLAAEAVREGFPPGSEPLRARLRRAASLAGFADRLEAVLAGVEAAAPTEAVPAWQGGAVPGDVGAWGRRLDGSPGWGPTWGSGQGGFGAALAMIRGREHPPGPAGPGGLWEHVLGVWTRDGRPSWRIRVRRLVGRARRALAAQRGRVGDAAPPPDALSPPDSPPADSTGSSTR